MAFPTSRGVIARQSVLPPLEAVPLQVHEQLMMCCKNLRYHRVGENGGSNQVSLDDRETAIYPDSNRQTPTYPLICPDTPQSHGLPHLSLRCHS